MIKKIIVSILCILMLSINCINNVNADDDPRPKFGDSNYNWQNYSVYANTIESYLVDTGNNQQFNEDDLFAAYIDLQNRNQLHNRGLVHVHYSYGESNYITLHTIRHWKNRFQNIYLSF